jgi:hypothetical protein
MPIRIRLSILMPIQIMTGSYTKFLFYLLVSVIGVNFEYFEQYIEIIWKKVKFIFTYVLYV